MSEMRQAPAEQAVPLFGTGGVRMVVLDVLIGLMALPAAALIREVLGSIDSPLGLPRKAPTEIGSPALWLTSLLSMALLPLALRAVDAGYPSSDRSLRRRFAAAAIWLVTAAGSLYLIDKDLESRALVLFAAIIIVVASTLVRLLFAQRAEAARAPGAALPTLSTDAEAALVRGEPISVSIARLAPALARPTVILEGDAIWIFPSALSPIDRVLKRALDTLLALLLIVLTLPIMAVVALLVLIREGRPILYADERAGMFGQPFKLHKFRTMRLGASAERAALWEKSDTKGPAFKMARDPRITPLGGFLRRFSLDELPQLFDVVAGRMSLIGPRPAGMDELSRYEDRHRLRLTVRPGITGLWQVRRRIDDDFEHRIADDLEYIRRWSPLLDLKIALRTIGVVLSGRGV